MVLTAGTMAPAHQRAQRYLDFFSGSFPQPQREGKRRSPVQWLPRVSRLAEAHLRSKVDPRPFPRELHLENIPRRLHSFASPFLPHFTSLVAIFPLRETRVHSRAIQP